MCAVSYIGDDWTKRIGERFPNHPFIPIVPMEPFKPFHPEPWKTIPDPGVSHHEFEELKKEVEALKELLKAAKKYDEATGQKDCHMDEKVALIKKFAEMVGVDMEDIFDRVKK